MVTLSFVSNHRQVSGTIPVVYPNGFSKGLVNPLEVRAGSAFGLFPGYVPTPGNTSTTQVQQEALTFGPGSVRALQAAATAQVGALGAVPGFSHDSAPTITSGVSSEFQPGVSPALTPRLKSQRMQHLLATLDRLPRFKSRAACCVSEDKALRSASSAAGGLDTGSATGVGAGLSGSSGPPLNPSLNTYLPYAQGKNFVLKYCGGWHVRA